ncbi:MAG: CPXCG motif-containing cysteine-rich protein [Vicinamibacterales bacterium]
MPDTEFTVTCPYCGEEVEIYLEPEVHGLLVQDCEVCCNPWQLRVVHDGADRWLDVSRADGSE